MLSQAVDHGLSPSVDLGIDKDPDLKSLHGDPRFAALVAHAKERAAAAQKPDLDPLQTAGCRKSCENVEKVKRTEVIIAAVGV